MSQRVRLVVSVDTEEDNWRPAREGVSVENIRELPRLAAFFQRLGIRPTYFTTYQVASQPWAAAVLADVARDGEGEVGGHLHPWNTPPLSDEPPPHDSMLNNYPLDIQLAKLACLTRRIEAMWGRPPTSFRAGRFGLNRDTVVALLRCGYRVDCSVTPFRNWEQYDGGPNFVGAPVHPYTLDGQGDVRVPVPGGGLVELPLTIGYTRLDPSRWPVLHRAFATPAMRFWHVPGMAARVGLARLVMLNPETDSLRDMLALTRRVVAGGLNYLHLFFHSSSLRPGLSPFTRSRRDVDRLYGALERYVDGLARMASIESVTASDTARATGLRVERTQSEAVAAPAALVRAGVTTETERAGALANAGRRLLIINYHYPPSGSAGGLRWAGLAKYLVRLGWEVHYLAGAPGVEPGVNHGVQIHVCSRFPTVNDLYRAIKRRVRRNGSNPDDGAHHLGPRAFGLLRVVRRELAALLSLPDEVSRGWVLRAAIRARSLIRRLEPTVVVTSGPPHPAHVVGMLATAGLRTPLVVDLRDPWILNGGLWVDHPVYGSTVGRQAIRRLERLVFHAARRVVTNTDELTEQLARCYPTLPVSCVPSGVDPERLPPPAQNRFPKLALSHVGTLYGARDLTPVIKALRLFLDRCPDGLSGESRLRIAGHVDPDIDARLSDQIAASGVSAAVERLGLLGPAEALDLLNRSHVSIVLAQDQWTQIPSKLYESVGMGIPTLVIAESHSAAGREARRVGAALRASDDVAGICDVFWQVWAGQYPDPNGAAAKVHYARRAKLMSDLLIEASGASL